MTGLPASLKDLAVRPRRGVIVIPSARIRRSDERERHPYRETLA